MSPPPAASGDGLINSAAEKTDPAGIETEINSLLIAWEYAPADERKAIETEINSLKIALDYAT